MVRVEIRSVQVCRNQSILECLKLEDSLGTVYLKTFTDETVLTEGGGLVTCPQSLNC